MQKTQLDSFSRFEALRFVTDTVTDTDGHRAIASTRTGIASRG